MSLRFSLVLIRKAKTLHEDFDNAILLDRMYVIKEK